MEISTKWNYSRKASFSYVTVHSTDEPRIQAQYLEYSEDNVALMDGKPGFYSIDSRRSTPPRLLPDRPDLTAALRGRLYAFLYGRRERYLRGPPVGVYCLRFLTDGMIPGSKQRTTGEK